MQNKVNIGLCGFGTVGKGVYDILNKNRDIITQKTGIEFDITKILVKNLKKHENSEIKNILTDDYKEIVNSQEIDIIVELIGGKDLANDIVIESLKKGKSVVTANKAILADNAKKIVKICEKNNTDIFFEASVAGGIPIIKIFKESLASNRIDSFYGILNGTSNYILTKMTDENREFNDVLKEAMKKGYAEADPTLDIEGIDACHKLSILVSLAFDTVVHYNKIYTEGITGISLKDIQFAEELGYTLKLLGIAKTHNGEIEARVHPTLISMDSLLANVKDAYNAIFINGDFIEQQFYFGKGAGRYPTASVVVSDIIEAGINFVKKCKARKPVYSVFSKYFKKKKILKITDIISKYYLRFNVVDKPGVLSKISGILGKFNISIEAVIQKGRDINKKGSVPIVMITHEAKERNIIKALRIIDTLNIVKDKIVLIRIEEKL